MRFESAADDAEMVKELAHVADDWYLFPEKKPLGVLSRGGVHDGGQFRIQGALNVRVGRVAYHACSMERRLAIR